MSKKVSRRDFVCGALGAGAIALAGCDATKGAASTSASADSASGAPTGTASLRCLDLHADTIDVLGMVDHLPYSGFNDKFSGTLASNNAQVSADRMGAMAWAQCYSIWVPDIGGEYKTDLPSIDWYHTASAWFKEQMAELGDRIEQAQALSDVTGILSEGKVAAVLAVENAICVDEKLEVVDEFAEDGVLIAGVTWNGRNALGSGNINPDEGLTDLGRSYVGSLEEHGIVLDVSHLNEKGFWDVEALATRPYIATHSNARAVCDHLRNLTDDQFRAIAARGGLVGLNLNEGFVRKGGHAYTFDELAAHVEHWLDLGGEDIIAFGSDRDGSEVPTWIADCGNQVYLYDRFCERIGEDVTRKLFFDNGERFFKAYEG